MEILHIKNIWRCIFKIPTPALLTKVIDGIDGLNLEGDSKGDLYEYLLSKLESARKKWTVSNTWTYHSDDGTTSKTSTI